MVGERDDSAGSGRRRAQPISPRRSNPSEVLKASKQGRSSMKETCARVRERRGRELRRGGSALQAVVCGRGTDDDGREGGGGSYKVGIGREDEGNGFTMGDELRQNAGQPMDNRRRV